MIPLDSKARALLTAIAAAGPVDLESVPVAEARKMVDYGYSRMKIPHLPVGAITDITVPADCVVPLRIYRPEGEGPFPVMVFFHGGGWVFFDARSYDPVCTHLCNLTRHIVVSADYRLAPENPYPAASDDCLATVRWVEHHAAEIGGKPGSLVVAGDSAGGNLAVVTAMRVRDEGGPVIGKQVLVYPVTDYCLPEKPSYLEFAEGFGLTRQEMFWFWDKYLADPGQASDQYVAPLRSGNLQGLPPTLLILAGYDTLRDEGMMFGEQLREAGNIVTTRLYGDMIHGFLSYLGILKQARTAVDDIAAFLAV